VILVKIDDPTGSYFGGKTAAPLFKVILESALAARDASLDRTVLAADRGKLRLSRAWARRCRSRRGATGDTASSFDTAGFGRRPWLPIDRPLSPAPSATRAPVVVPDLRGLTLRARPSERCTTQASRYN